MVRVTVHGIKSGNACICCGGGGSRTGLTIIGVMQSPHPRSIVVVQAPIIFFALKGLDKCVIFFTIRVFRGLALPCPIIISLLLLIFCFLGQSFLGGLSLAHRFRLGILGGGASMFLF